MYLFAGWQYRSDHVYIVPGLHDFRNSRSSHGSLSEHHFQNQTIRVDFGRGVPGRGVYNPAEYRRLIAAFKKLVGYIQRAGKCPSAYSLPVHTDSQLLVGPLALGWQVSVPNFLFSANRIPTLSNQGQLQPQPSPAVQKRPPWYDTYIARATVQRSCHSRKEAAKSMSVYEQSAREIYDSYAQRADPADLLRQSRIELATRLRVEEGFRQEEAYHAADQMLAYARQTV